MKQRTIKNTIKFKGRGIHTGVYTNMRLVPSKENTGIIFKRTDLKNKPCIEAHVKHVYSTKRSTNLKKDNVSVNTVEHILAAVAGAEIDNIIIEIDNIEIPILDGSSKDFTHLIEENGYIEQDANKDIFAIKRKIIYKDTDGAKYIAEPNDTLSIFSHIIGFLIYRWIYNLILCSSLDIN